MQSTAKHRPRLILELLRHVAEISQASSILSLALLNKVCYHNTIDILYRVVTITSTDKLGRFSRALLSGRPSLCLFTRSLHIDIRGNYSFQKPVRGNIRDILLAVKNLDELTLDVHGVIEDLSNDGSLESAPFRLKYLACWAVREPSFLKFLFRQDGIETLDLLHEPLSISSGLPNAKMAIGEPDVLLPKLRFLTAQPVTIALLAPGRPISRVCFKESILSSNLGPIISRISLASAPTVYLNVAIGVRGLPKCEAEFEILLSHLSYCRETLENLTIRVTLLMGFSRMGLTAH
ncbi:hypothetical protein FRC08_006927 [Ceratobasidium sp. 394]|nr:hypothetical protein FRC08_006927 [Ceratobasidium sp. 394]